MTAADDVAAVLEWCADFLDVNGWCQGTAFYEGRACAAGAFIMANRVHGDKVVDAARDLFRFELTGWEDGAIGPWNDTPGRTHGEVTDLFRTLAKRVREGDLVVS